jgi:hypothetical protein
MTKIALEKTCTTCKLTKGLANFSIRRASPDGLMQICKECACKKQKEYANKNVLRKEVKQGERKLCPKCHTEKPPTEFPINKRNRDGLGGWCLSCERLKASVYYNLNSQRTNIDRASSKTCSICNIQKIGKDFYNNDRNLDGLGTWCKRCQRNKGISYRYDILPEQYESMVTSQGGVCAICKRVTENFLHVDHCHSTKRIRGLLCINCNLGLGAAKDSLLTLESFVRYLEEWSIPENDVNSKNVFLATPKISMCQKRGLLDGQDNKCKICGVCFTTTKAVLDHCHKSNAVRGYLCNRCNRGLGHFFDSTKVIRSALEYLKKV